MCGYPKSTNGGLSFLPEFYIVPPFINQKNPTRIVLTAAGFYILYLDETNWNVYVLCEQSNPSLNIASQVNSTPGKAGAGGGLAVDPTGTSVYVVYSDTTNDPEGDIRFCKRSDSGTTWGNCVTVNDNTSRSQTDPSLFRDANGTLHVIWTDFRSNSTYRDLLRIFELMAGVPSPSPTPISSPDQPSANFRRWSIGDRWSALPSITSHGV